ncbi:phosphatidylinositol alpha 1,6-mannosyltransferase [Marchantia polymorpha subsp. ruderalis]|uniref:Glycosyltransferase subfamily 4-like N-terminal domain-containing protein n=2 Tax=Marchantia polymorpha TaxID=3197 RepID=A0A176WHK7_MARPO|nr:hypothetical protein AXG93_3384s1100 [Marchantia polymorpha subsp. ruderalis]PTQ30153.1 hypothetical protein MARPO_0129s0040 [Marchantia polymorpha]BBN01770.1 hypothetical protein Mp_2g10160 [Marchantia polymorpha subsp. ruderalis]|eukprot:PTQ30153.1 hypothetical protein MARPO_0129s0040 [Marchantia polymorpha]
MWTTLKLPAPAVNVPRDAPLALGRSPAVASGIAGGAGGRRWRDGAVCGSGLAPAPSASSVRSRRGRKIPDPCVPLAASPSRAADDVARCRISSSRSRCSIGVTRLSLSRRQPLRVRSRTVVNCRMADEEALLSPGSSSAAELREREEQAREWAHQPRRIALFVEPSPFAYICGYKNRFQNFIKYLREMGDEVLIVTTHEGVPTEFCGAKVVGSWSFRCPLYTILPLSLALSPRIYREVADFKPDIIHASSPGVMVFGALIIAKLLSVPIVMSYHTHVPMYIPKYTFSWLVTPMWWVIRFLHRAADLTLVMSSALGKELKAAGAAAADKIGIWSKGVDSESFHPRFRSQEMRVKLTKGQPATPLIVHVGRLGAEKNLEFFKLVMEKIPEAHLAIVGDGPYRGELEKMLEGKKVTFTGMLQGEELSQAYASADVFITPSETETLGFVVLEAMASGIPVVCARAGGIIDIVNKEGETGFLYTPGDLDDCVGKLKDLLHSPELRRKIGSAGREEVENFDWRASTRQVRNEMYTTAIWFWRRKREQLSNRFSWWPMRPAPVTT